jgi:branched-chain amino acid transport system ATP-binding protein
MVRAMQSSPMRERARCILAIEALKLTNIDSYYGESHVLHGVGFSLEEKRVLALLGRNGAGKTTCISSIMGFLAPRNGEISLFGKSIGGLAPEAISRLGIGLVPQGRRIFPSLSVRENLIIARQREKESEHPWTIERIFELFPGLGERVRQLAGSLSGGEQQMLAIGRALMSTPRILLLDEPSLGLAPILVHRIFDVIQEINHQGVSILLVEQNAHQALALARRGYVLETGRISAEGATADLQSDRRIQAAYLGGSAFGGRGRNERPPSSSG